MFAIALPGSTDHRPGQHHPWLVRAGRLVRLAAAASLLAWGSIDSGLWGSLGEARRTWGDDYSALRLARSFRGLPVDALAADLQRQLPPQEPVALAPELSVDPFVRLRLAEGLYPRRVVPAAAHTIELRGGRLVLSGPPVPALEPPEVPAAGLHWLLRVAVGLGCALGLGWALGWGRRTGVLPGLLAGALAVGLLGTIATWLQVPVPRSLVLLTGGAGLLLAAWLWKRAPVSPAPAAALHPESLLVVALLVLIGLRASALPVAGWDGRSVWLLRAHQLAVHGHFDLADATNAALSWSHPEYPLLLPAWMSLCGAGGPFSERAAVVGLVLLLASLVLLLRRLAAPVLGRLEGFGLAVTCALLVAELTAEAYADGVVLLLLLIAWFALSSASEAGERSGGLALAAAALTKQEGLLFGAALALGFALFDQRRRALEARSRWRPLLWLVPGAVHVAWAKALGLRGDFGGIRWSEVAGEVTTRLPLIIEGVPGEAWAAGACALVCALWYRESRPALALGLFLLGAELAMFLVTPQDVAWHVRTALGRLTLHPQAFFAVAVLSAGRQRTPDSPPSD